MSILDFLKGRGLTKPGVVGPDGNVQFFDSPQAQAQDIAKVQTAPETNYDSGPIPQQNDDGSSQPDMPDRSVVTPGKDATPFQPTFAQAATDRYGNVTRTPSPALTKLGLFAKILKGGLQGTTDAIEGGALDAVPGRSAFGAGYSAAQQMPLVRQQRQLGTQKAQIENDMLQGGTQPVSTPWGQMPMWKAKQVAEYQAKLGDANKDRYVTPRNGGVYDTMNGTFAPGTEPQDKTQNTPENRQSFVAQNPNLFPDENSKQQYILYGSREPNEQDPKTSFQAYQSAFKKQNGRDMTPDEISAYDKQHAQNIHITNPGASGVVPEIKPSSPQFKVAQDLAYGRITMPQFRSLTAYSRDTGTKMAIYQKAGELNPGFNPAQFEMGYKLASSPKVQQQMASLDNVIQAVPDLVQASDNASRIGIKKINQITNWAGAEFGGHKYSNFHTAQIAFADELSGALGYGSATDMSRAMGLDMTDPNLGPAQFASAIREVVVPFINRKRSTLLNQMNVYGQPGMNPAADAPKEPPAKTSSPSTHGVVPRKDGVPFFEIGG